ncbi:MAG: phosphoribosylglycinamide formyltransferase [Planctomycetes bacterium]|nr:phosphoribosylglycinamide formyltransferase [Planctomycetota bacterium]
MPTTPLNLGVLISGGGRTLLNLHERILAGTLPAKIAVVVCSRAAARGVQRARDRGLNVQVVDRAGLAPKEFQDRITAAVAGVDLVCMAGFLSLWRFPEEFVGRVMNIHPALLPDFGGSGMFGHRVHEAVLAAGRSESGCTVHFCDNQYDHGPIILQRRVPVLPGDSAESLAARVFEQECLAYPLAIEWFAAGRLRLQGGKVSII